jgi:hypothetical protein
LVEQEKNWGDVCKHGISTNHSAIDTFFKFNNDFGIVKGDYSYEQVLSLQSTTMAEHVYAALGFRDLGRLCEYVPVSGAED